MLKLRGLNSMEVAVGLAVPVFVYILLAVVKFLWKFWQFKRVGMQFPSPPFHWLHGNLHLTDGYFGEKFLATTREVVEKHPRAHALWLSPLVVGVQLTHPETIKQLLRVSTKKSADYDQLRPWLGNGLIMSDGDVWKVHRRLLTPAFHFDVLKQYVSVYNKAAEQLIETLSKFAENRDSFEMFQQASLCTMEVILQCAFSSGGMSEQTKRDYVAAVHGIGLLSAERDFNPIYAFFTSIYNLSPGGREFNRLCEFIHGTADSIIKTRRQQLDNHDEVVGQKKRLDFIDILLTARDEDGRGLTDVEIRQEVDTFLFAGHDTTASALSWTLYSLAQHPHHQDKVLEEVNHLLSGRDDDTIQWDDLPKLPYLTMCLKEAMRLHTPVPHISRATKEKCVIEGVNIPKDMYMGISIYGLNHNPAVWGPDHMEFDPSRFHADRLKDMDSHAFIPFSVGQRNCIGQNFALNEEKVLLARLIHKFVFAVDPSRPAVKEMGIVMRARGGMWMKVTPVS
ncbi:leukotriene-B4 omega-hydroxylase 3-like [Branchiostoma lanceolatum]|uniref:leukotriene-B4 omega-hydroxylase 3-like n=1 Tax=Branchiostoma lanceolatum TaxID=7740 RepID=UPI003454369E